MNRAGANIASVYSLRPLPGAPVSTPLDWDELDADLEPGDFRIDNVWERFAAGDRFRPVLDDKQSLSEAMEALGLTSGTTDPPRERSPPRSPPKRSARPTGRASLDEYAAKRDFQRTPEPSGAPAPPSTAGTPAPPSTRSTPAPPSTERTAAPPPPTPRPPAPPSPGSAPAPPSPGSPPAPPPAAGGPQPHPPVDGAPTGRVADGGSGGDRRSPGPATGAHQAGAGAGGGA